MKYFVNSTPFNTVKELEEHIRSILYAGRVNEPLSQQGFEFMHDYFQQFHVEFDQKEGCGIREIRKVLEPMYGKYRGFQIVRIDGSTTDISYKFSNISKKRPFHDLKTALRQLIEPQVYAFKKQYLDEYKNVTCSLTGEPLHMGYCHVDHFKPTFHEMVQQFCLIHGIGDSEIERIISPPTDNQLYPEIIDLDVKTLFYQYHLDNANLRLLSPLGNLSHARKQ